MTRKRFVKLLMADGHSRNDANERADYARGRNVSYQRAYFVNIFAKQIASAGVVSTKAGEALLFAAQAIKAFASESVKTAQSISNMGKKCSILLCDELEVNHE